MKRRDFIKRGVLLVPSIFIQRLIPAQTVLNAGGLAGFIPPSTAGGGGGGSFTFVSSTSSTGTTSTNNTTSGINTTGANLLAACVTYTGGSVASINDSKGNTWTTGLSSTFGGSNPKSIWFYCTSPTVGSVHTFTAPARSGTICNIHVYAFAKSGGSPSFQTGTDNEVHSNNWAGGSGVKPGSVTPGNANSLFLSAVIFDVAATGIATNSGFTIPNAVCSPPGPGIQSAYKIKSSSSIAEDPIWTCSTGNADAFANQVVFN
jgi:hypothetical protein